MFMFTSLWTHNTTWLETLPKCSYSCSWFSCVKVLKVWSLPSWIMCGDQSEVGIHRIQWRGDWGRTGNWDEWDGENTLLISTLLNTISLLFTQITASNNIKTCTYCFIHFFCIYVLFSVYFPVPVDLSLHVKHNTHPYIIPNKEITWPKMLMWGEH